LVEVIVFFIDINIDIKNMIHKIINYEIDNKKRMHAEHRCFM